MKRRKYVRKNINGRLSYGISYFEKTRNVCGIQLGKIICILRKRFFSPIERCLSGSSIYRSAKTKDIGKVVRHKKFAGIIPILWSFYKRKKRNKLGKISSVS